MVDVKGAYVLTYKHVGYFPTVDATRVLSLFENNGKVKINEIKGFRKEKKPSEKEKPEPYINITNENRKIIKINYNFVKHGDLNLENLLDVIENEADTVVLKRLCIQLNNEIIFPPSRDEHNDQSAVAIFESHYEETPEEEEKKNKYLERIEEYTPEKLFEDGFKHTSLDISALQHARAWMNNSRRGFYKGEEYGSKGILTDVEATRRIMKAIDKNGQIRSIRNLDKGAKDAWVYDGEVRC